MLGALVAWNLGNFAFFIAAGRMLGPDDYGMLAALLATTVVAMAVASAFQYAIARDESAYVGGPASGALYVAAYREALVAVPVLALVAIICVVLIEVRAPDVPAGEISAAVVVMLPMTAFYLSCGQLQAEHRFRAFAFATGALGVPRPIVLVPLVWLGIGVYAGLIASACAVALAAFVGVVATRDAFGRASRLGRDRWRNYHRSLPSLIAGLAGIALLTNLDVIVAKLSLSPPDAGVFGAVAVLGKAVVVVPQAVSTVVLPRVARRRASGVATGPLLAAAIGVAVAIGGAATVVMWLAADLILGLTYGEAYLGGGHLLGPMAAAATLLGVLIVLLNHHLGRGADAFAWGLLAVAVCQAALLALFHGSAGQIIAVDIAACLIGVLAHELVIRTGPDGIVAGAIRGVAARRRRAER